MVIFLQRLHGVARHGASAAGHLPALTERGTVSGRPVCYPDLPP